AVLRDVLKAFREDSVLSAAALAQKMDIQEFLLLHLLDELVRMGYLEESSNSASCNGCMYATSCGTSCNTSSSQRLWWLTPKGWNSIK
ncbi:MAG: FeoC-like transcriptional regulator, partial [Anaerolineae bacterium]|nr:FeoC-like transcriptional regulator [Anaerolineae bacterium]